MQKLICVYLQALLSVDSFKKGAMRFRFMARCRERGAGGYGSKGEEVGRAGKQGAQEFVFPEG